jgi:hypothetical protein
MEHRHHQDTLLLQAPSHAPPANCVRKQSSLAWQFRRMAARRGTKCAATELLTLFNGVESLRPAIVIRLHIKIVRTDRVARSDPWAFVGCADVAGIRLIAILPAPDLIIADIAAGLATRAV